MTHSLFQDIHNLNRTNAKRLLFQRAKIALVLPIFFIITIGVPDTMFTNGGIRISLNGSTPIERVVPFQVRGSIPYWDQENAVASFKEHVNQFSSVSLFWYYLTNTGEIGTYRYAAEDKAIIDFAHAHNVKVFATLTNLPESEGASWDSKRVERVLRSPESRQRHIRNIEQKLDALNFDGVSIDYEEVAEKEKDKFSQFIAELADVLHQKGKMVGVALHPKSGNRIPNENNGSYSQDWKRLAESADQLYIMAYGEHWDGSDPGPMASSPWVKRIIRYADSLHVPKEKFYLGVPLYGYAWEVNNAEHVRGLTYQEVKKILSDFGVQEKWDEYAGTPFFHYADKGERYEVWFENAASIKEKASLAYDASFAGVSLWRLGGEDPEIWSKLPTFKLGTPNP